MLTTKQTSRLKGGRILFVPLGALKVAFLFSLNKWILKNSFTFNDMMRWKNEIITKDFQVREARHLSNFIINLQLERHSVLRNVLVLEIYTKKV